MEVENVIVAGRPIPLGVTAITETRGWVTIEGEEFAVRKYRGVWTVITKIITDDNYFHPYRAIRREGYEGPSTFIPLAETFYAAGPSIRPDAVNELAHEFERRGLFWCGDHKWTEWSFDDLEREGACEELSIKCIKAVQHADIFTSHLWADVPTTGTWTELGVRLSCGGHAHVIHHDYPTEKDVFLNHPKVRLFRDTKEFLAWFDSHLDGNHGSDG